jgi:hypothetical protein
MHLTCDTNSSYWNFIGQARSNNQCTRNLASSRQDHAAFVVSLFSSNSSFKDLTTVELATSRAPCTCYPQGRAMAQAVSRRPLTAESWFRARVNPCGICGGQRGTGTGFSPSSSGFPCQYQSTVVLHTHNHLGEEQYVL